MKPLDMTNVVASSRGGNGDYKNLKPGKYACMVTKVTDAPSYNRLDMLVDVTVGEFASYFSDSFYDNKPWAHTQNLWYNSLEDAKRDAEIFTECNPGFDGVAALSAGKEQLFVNKAIGIVFRNEEYYDEKTDKFIIGSNPRPAFFCTLSEVESWTNGNQQEPKPKMLTEKGYRSALSRKRIDPDEWLRKHGGDWHGEPVPTSNFADDSDVPF